MSLVGPVGLAGTGTISRLSILDEIVCPSLARPMHVIPVIDLLQGEVVRGVAGNRSEYAPVQSCLTRDAAPTSVATAFAQQFGFRTTYVADLDAIQHCRPDFDSWQRIAACGLDIWLDAGIGDLAAAQKVLQQAEVRRFTPRLVIGLESLESPDELTALCHHTPDPIFSLDLKSGSTLLKCAAWRELSPVEIAVAAFDCGVRDMIVLDLADVGVGQGTRTLSLCREIRQKLAVRELIAGGGVRSVHDLTILADAGCDAALVASALHDGRLTPSQLREANFLPPGDSLSTSYPQA